MSFQMALAQSERNRIAVIGLSMPNLLSTPITIALSVVVFQQVHLSVFPPFDQSSRFCASRTALFKIIRIQCFVFIQWLLVNALMLHLSCCHPLIGDDQSMQRFGCSLTLNSYLSLITFVLHKFVQMRNEYLQLFKHSASCTQDKRD